VTVDIALSDAVHTWS